MNFIVTVMCAVKLSTACPLPDQKPIVNEFVASSEHDCQVKVENLIAAYNYDKTQFQVKCKKQ